MAASNIRVLVACEYSATVRDAFRARGFDAWSCDLLPTEGDPRWHIQGDALEVAYSGEWSAMVGHPPCTHLSFAGKRYWNAPGKEEKRAAGMSFFMALYNAPIPHVALENPMGLPHTDFRKADQIIHPYFFGDRVCKRTCLWLRRLPPLIHRATDELFGPRTHTDYPEPVYVDASGKARHWTEANHGGHARSASFASIADAMATQWGDYLLSLYAREAA